MAQAGPKAGNIYGRGQSKIHVGNNIEDLIHFDVNFDGAQNTGDITVHFNAHSPRHFHFPDIPQFFSYLRAATSAFRFILPVSLVADRLLSIDILKKYDYKEEFADICRDISPGTCKWILKHDNLLWWLNHPDYRLLWMTGGPGMGKTRLAAYIIQTLKERLRGQQPRKPYVVLYTLCNSQENNSVSSLLCVALHQLLEEDPEVAALADLRRLRPVQSKQSETPPWSVAPDLIWNLFCDVIQKANLKRVYLIIDGLDDCDASGQVEMFRLLLRNSPSNLSILITSQPLEDVRIEISKYLTNQPYYRYFDLSNEQTALNADIDAVIDKEMCRIAKLRGYSAQQTETTSQFLKKRRSGSFLPVILVMAKLERTPANALRFVLDSTSNRLEELDDLYRKLLAAIPKEAIERCSEMLNYMLYVYRPLTVAELAFACDYKSTTSCGESDLNLDEVPYQDLRGDLKLLGPIIQIRHGDDTIHFFHSSARKFLEEFPLCDDSSSLRPSILPARLIHTQLANFCINGLISHSDEIFPSSWEDSYAAKLQAIFGKYTLLEYAFDHWDLHLAQAFNEEYGAINSQDRSAQAFSGRLQLIRSLDVLADILNDPTRRSFAVYFATLQSGLLSPWLGHVTPVHLYVQLGLHTLLQDELEKYQQSFPLTSDPSSFVSYALCCAAWSGNLRTFQIVLDHFTVEIDGPDYQNLLEFATRSGNAELVRYILAHRKVSSKELAKAVLEATAQADGSVLEALGDVSVASLRAKDDAGRNVLHNLVLLATDKGSLNLDVVLNAICFFKGRGVGLNEPDGFGNTILHHICWSNSLCQKPLLRSLLGNKADPHIRNLCGSLPLHLASRKASFEAFDFLLTETKSNHSENSFTIQPLETVSESIPSDAQVALRAPDHDLVQPTSTTDVVNFVAEKDGRLFLSRGGLTPLHWAVSRSCSTAYSDDMMVFRSLLKQGFSMTTLSKDGRSPLSIANDNPEILHVLCLVYYRLDGAGHMGLSLPHTVEILCSAKCVDDIWTGLDFTRNFDYLFRGKRITFDVQDETTCIQRAIVVYFVLPGSNIKHLLTQLINEPEVVKMLEELSLTGQPWDYTNTDIVKLRQCQVLEALQKWEKSEGKLLTVVPLENSVNKVRRRHLLQNFSSNSAIGGSTTPNASSPHGLPATRDSREMKRKTIRKIDRVLLLEDWQEFLWSIFAMFTVKDLSASLACLRLLPTLSEEKIESLSAVSETKIEALTRLRRLLEW